MKKHFLLLSLLAIAFQSQAQRGFPGILQRYQVGYSFVVANAQYETKSFFFSDLSTIGNIDTTYKGTLNTKATFGVTMGTYIPLKRLGQKSSLALGIDFLYNILTWEDKATNSFAGFDGFTAQASLPVGLDFKFGADAVTDKAIRFCATVGAGGSPSYSISTLTNGGFDIDPKFNITPYVKGEVGIFAGICMKVRAIYTFTDVNYLDYGPGRKTDPFFVSESNTKFIGKNTLTLSLIVMPFSWTWKRSEWWNTY